MTWTFLSTPSARRATGCLFHLIGGNRYFYPRPPRGGRPKPFLLPSLSSIFLSTPSARRATDQHHRHLSGRRFLSTPSARRATAAVQGAQKSTTYFYPRPPRGGRRRCSRCGSTAGCYFYPRPPRGGRPRKDFVKANRRAISIHALREEGDVCDRCGAVLNGNFYPRPPRGGRR